MKINPSYVVMGISIFLVATLVLGAILMPFSLRISGRYHRTQGICQTAEAREVERVSQKGTAYRPIWSVSVYSLDDVNLTFPLFSNVAGFEGDLSSIQPFFTSKSKAYAEIEKFPAGTLVPCLYPADPLHYPAGGSVMDTRAVFLGNYTQKQQDKAYKKADAFFTAGAILIVIGGIFTVGASIFMFYKCCKPDSDKEEV